MKFAVVVPAFNEQMRIGAVLRSLTKLTLPVVVVDDGSSDQTYQIASRYNVKLLRHRINLGKGAALKTGCLAAFSIGADAVIMMDSDGQHKVEDLPKFINMLKAKKYDVIFGSRNLNLKVPLDRFIGNKFASALISFLFGIYISDILCGFRALTERAFKKLNLQSSNYGIETEMVIRAGKLNLRHCELPVQTVYYERFKGVTILDAVGILLDIIRWRTVK